MKQQELFSAESRQKGLSKWTLFVDGASRNNPGPAGVGICLCKDRVECACYGFFLGKATNNEAEYQALVLGLLLARRHLADGERLEICSDSELLVKQILGEYRVKKPELRMWYDRAVGLLRHFSYSITHVLRAHNMRADQLANEGIDKKNPVPADLIQELNRL